MGREGARGADRIVPPPCAGFFWRDGAGVARPRLESFSRWTLPITALRLTPPSSSAIWLAVEPPSHIFFKGAMRSSVQLIGSVSILSFIERVCAPVLACQGAWP